MDVSIKIEGVMAFLGPRIIAEQNVLSVRLCTDYTEAVMNDRLWVNVLYMA